MDVYLVMYTWQGDTQCLGVFANEALAQFEIERQTNEWLNKHSGDVRFIRTADGEWILNDSYDIRFWIEEFPVQGLVMLTKPVRHR